MTHASTNRYPLVVLKFGSSFLTAAADLPRAVRAIQRRLRDGRRVLAVVSAFGDTTDRLLADARRLSERPTPPELARLLAGGEREATALLVRALERAGVPSAALDPAQGCLRASGPILDASDVRVDVGAFARAFERADVCVVPGFHARHGSSDAICLFGRGGSDLTAVVCSHALDAERCLLLKDVDGLYERDPSAAQDPDAPKPRRFAAVTIGDAAALDGSIVQRKALDFARAHAIQFEVGDDGPLPATRVGAERSRFDDASGAVAPCARP